LPQRRARVADAIPEFKGVRAEIVEFVGAMLIDVVDVFPAIGADGSVAHVAHAGKHGVGIVLDEDGVALGNFRRGEAGPAQAHGEQIGGKGHRVNAGAARVGARIADEKGDADGLFVGQAALRIQAVLAVEVAVVGGEDDGGVVERVGAFERLDQAAEAFVDGFGHAHAVEDCCVVGGGGWGERGAAGDSLLEGGFVGGHYLVVATAGWRHASV
jgi:hypothetical protein